MTPVLLDTFVKFVLPTLATAAGTGLVWLLTKAATWMTQQKTDSKAFAVLARVSHLAATVVSDVEATLRPQIVAAAADGKLTAQEGSELRAAALARLKSLLGAHGLEELRGVLGIFMPQVDSYLGGLIETKVAEIHTHIVPVLPVAATVTATPVPR